MLCHKVSRLEGSVCALPQSTARAALLLCTAFLPIWNSDKIFLLYHKTTSTSQKTHLYHHFLTRGIHLHLQIQEKETEIKGNCSTAARLVTWS